MQLKYTIMGISKIPVLLEKPREIDMSRETGILQRRFIGSQYTVKVYH